MKNIHIIPTDKPSRLVQAKNLYFYKDGIEKEFIDEDEKLLNIYITSNEEIKEGDYFLSCENTIEKYKGATIPIYLDKKIILTTDELYIHNDLIPKEYNPFPQYIQKIDDDFLQWFVKNPSCEEVNVESNYRVKSGTIQEHKNGVAGYEYHEYKIIIPKEEPEQHIELINDNIEEFDKAIKLFKQETLEEEARDAYNTSQERSYSEEEVLAMLSEVRKGSMVISKNTNRTYWEFDIKSEKKWFEQFKKK